MYCCLDSWLFCTVKNLFDQSAARYTLLYPLCFSRLMRNKQKDLAEKKSRWIINNLSDVLVCSIAEYFYSLFVFWCSYENTAKLVKVLSDSTHQNV